MSTKTPSNSTKTRPRVAMKPLPVPTSGQVRRVDAFLKSSVFSVVPESDWPAGAKVTQFKPLAVWLSSRFLVMEAPSQDTGSLGVCRHLMVRPHNGQHPGWKTLQAIKSELLGEDAWAMEIFPPQCLLVDDADMYHLWVLTDTRLMPGTRI